MSNEYDDLLAEQTAPSSESNEYLNILDDERKFQSQDLQQTYYNNVDKEPNKQAQYLKLSKEMNIPLGVVERNFDSLSKKKKVSDNDYYDLVDKQPAVSRWLGKPENAAIGHDDLDNLKKVEKLSKFKMPKKDQVADYLPEGFRPAVETGLNNLAISAINVMASTGKISPEDAVQNIANLNALNKEIREKAPDFVKDWNEAMAKEGAERKAAWAATVASYEQFKKERTLEALVETTKGGFNTIGEALDFVHEISLARPRGMAYATVENLTRMSPNFLLGALGAKAGGSIAAVAGQLGPQAATPEEVVTVPAGAAIGGMAGFFAGGTFIETGAWIQQRIEEKVEDPTDPEQLLSVYRDPKFMAEVRAEGLRKGVTTAAVDAVFNAFAGKILTGAGVKAAPTVAKKVAEAGKAGAKELGTQAVGESVGEAAGQVAAFKGDVGKVDFNDVLAEGVLSMGHSSVEVAVGASRRVAYSVQADRAAQEIVVDNEKAFKAIQDAEQLQALSEMTEVSPVSERSPEAFAELIDFAAEDNAKDVFFQTDDWDSYWNRKGESPADKLAEITGQPDAYHEAKNNGLDLQVPLKEYVTKLAKTEDIIELNKVARTDPDGMNLNEAREHLAALPATVQEVAKDAEAQLTAEQQTAEIKENIKSQLVENVGMSAGEARIYSEVLEGFRVLAERQGIDPQVLFDRYNLTVSGPGAVEQPGRVAAQEYAQAELKNKQFYSKLQKTLTDKIQGSAASVDQVRGLIKDLKPEEIEWSGIDAFLEGKKKVSKQELMDYLRANEIKVEPVVLGEQNNLQIVKTLPSYEDHIATDMEKNPDLTREQAEDRAFRSATGAGGGASFPDYYDIQIREEFRGATGDTESRVSGPKFEKYTLPGGENYREVLFRLPPREFRPELIDIEAEVDRLAPKSTTREEDKFAVQFSIKRNEFFNEIEKENIISDEDIAKGLAQDKADEEAFKRGAYSREDLQNFKDIESRQRADHKKRREIEKDLDAQNKKKIEAMPKPQRTYTTGHFDQDNILAHIRINDRVDKDGNKVLFVEEIQSDWHQEGRKKGYISDIGPELKELPEGTEIVASKPAIVFGDQDPEAPRYSVVMPDGRRLILGLESEQAAKEAALRKLNREARKGKIPDAPFKKTWHELALKNVIQMAVEGGYDKIAWTPGDVQAERYDLSKRVGKLSYQKNDNNEYIIDIEDPSGRQVDSRTLPENDLDSYIGKELAQKIIDGEGRGSGQKGDKRKILEGLDLKVGGEGMKGFYDNILVKSANKLVKKLGAKVGSTEVETEPEIKTQTSHSIEVTDKMKEFIQGEGFSLFQEGKRGKITFGDNRSVDISLLENKDPSTFLHEMGHFYLEVLADLATAKDAPKDMQDDFQTILDWFGVKDRDGIQTEQHEQFARGFEAFLMEGKAPSSKLRKAFRAFRTWLTTVYKKIQNLNVNLTDEVRDVMARLLATEVEIQAARDKLNLKPFLDPQVIPGKKGERYRNAALNALQDAEDQLSNKLIEGVKNKRTKDYKKKLAKEKEAVTEQVDSMKIYQSIDALKQMKTPDGKPMKLSKASLLRFIDKEQLKKIKGLYTTKDYGMDVEVFASMMNFENANEFIDEAVNAPKKKDLIESLTNQRMAQKFPDLDPLLDQIQVEEDALLAVHNDKRAELMELELQLLASNDPAVFKDIIKQVTKRPPKAKNVRDTAKKIIAKMQVKNIRPIVYERAESKAAKLAGEALAKGDLSAAFEFKQKELINYYLYKEAVDAKTSVEKGNKSFRRFNKKDEDLAKTRDINLVNAGRSLLARFGISKAGNAPESYLDSLKTYDSDAYDSMSVLIETVESKATSINDMTYDEYQDLKTTVDSLWQLAKTSKEIEIDGKRMSRDKAIKALSEEITKYAKPGDRPGYKKAITKWENTKMGLLGMRASLRRVESWVDAMDLGKQGVFRKFIWNPISEATDKYRSESVVFLNKYQELLKPIEKGLTGDKIEATEIDYTFQDKAELLGAMLHTGNQSNLQKLLRGRNWGEFDLENNLDTTRWDAFVNRMIREGKLTKQDYDFMQSVWDLLEEIKPMAQKAHKEMYGHFFDEVTAQEFTNEFGTYRGGYMPAKADPNIVEDAAIRQEKESIEKFNNSFAFPTTGRGATKKRVEKYAAPLIFDLRQVPQHLDWALRFSLIEPRVKDVAKIVTNKNFREVLSTLDTQIGSGMLVPWLQRAAAQKVETPTQDGRGWQLLARIAKNIRTNAGLSIMVGNVTNTLQQFTGLSIAVIKVKPRHLRNALWRYMTDGKTMQAEIAEKSEFMNTRVATQVFDVAKRVDDIILNPTKYEKARRFALEHGYILQQYTQNIVDNMVWGGAYEEAIERGATEKEAVREANSAVRLTQGSFNAEDISRFESGTAFHRMFTMFYSYFNMQANLLGSEFVQIMRDAGVSNGKGRLLYLYTFGFMIPAFMSEIIVKTMAGSVDEDDDDKYLDDYMAMFIDSQVRTGTAMFPFVGPTVQAGINAANDKWYDDRISTSPAISILESSVTGNVKNVKRAIEGKDVNSKRATKDALTAISIFTGLPAAPLARPIGFLQDVESGRAQPTGPIDFTRGLITGKSGQ